MDDPDGWRSDFGVGVGIGIGIDPHCVTSSFSCPNLFSSPFDTDSDPDTDTEGPPTPRGFRS